VNVGHGYGFVRIFAYVVSHAILDLFFYFGFWVGEMFFHELSIICNSCYLLIVFVHFFSSTRLPASQSPTAARTGMIIYGSGSPALFTAVTMATVVMTTVVSMLHRMLF
jgi:hypothetical protein